MGNFRTDTLQVDGAAAVGGNLLVTGSSDVDGASFVGGALIAEGPVVRDGALSPAALAAGTTKVKNGVFASSMSDVSAVLLGGLSLSLLLGAAALAYFALR